MDTTVISDAVNLASRVESLTKTYRVPLIITEETYQALHEPAAISVRRIDRVLVQGKSQPVVLYEVMDADDRLARLSKQRTLADFEAGQACYERRDFPGAINNLTRVRTRDPLDTVVEVLLERARRFSGDAEA